jgi:hypothetical protein
MTACSTGWPAVGAGKANRRRHGARRLTGLLVALGCCWAFCRGTPGARGAIPSRWSDGADRVSWKTGPSFERALTGRMGVTWSGIALRSAVERLARTQQVAIFLDRRLDPSQPIEFRLHDTTLGELIERLAASIDAETAVIGSVIYLGPPGQSGRLADLARSRREEAARLPRAVSRRVMDEQTWCWPSASEPSSLLEELARQAAVRFPDHARVPHDVWPAMELPALAWTDRLTLVLAGFDLTFRFEDQGRAVRFEPLAEQTPIVRHYPHTLSQRKLQEILSEFPAATVSQSGDQLVLRGTAGEHARLGERLRQPLGRAERSRQPSERTVYTLNVQQQRVEDLLHAVCQRSDLELDTRLVSPETLQTRISLGVQEASLEELLSAILTPIGMQYRLDDGRLVVLPNPRDR